MRTLPLFKFGSRARSTSWGVALCTMFIVASFSVVDGLKNSMDKLEENFSSEYYLVTVAGDDGPGYFSASSLSQVANRSALGIFTEVIAHPSMTKVVAFCVEDPYRSLPETIITTGEDILLGQSLQLTGDITLGSIDVTIAGRYSSAMFPSDWILGSSGLLENLTGGIGVFNFAISKGLSQLDMSVLDAAGFSVQPMVGIVEFLDSSVSEIESDATWALLPSVFVIAVLAYSFIGSETADRRHDIGILKTIGAGRWRILAYLVTNAVLISAWGSLLGLALGLVLSYGVSTVASAMFTSVFVTRASEMLLAVAFAVSVGAGIVGAVIPAVRMTFSSPVEDLKEVAPFS